MVDEGKPDFAAQARPEGNSSVDKVCLSEGKMFHGSSIAEWKEINGPDMVLMPVAREVDLLSMATYLSEFDQYYSV